MPTPKVEPEMKVPSDLRKALVVAPSVETQWKDITPVARRDFITWIESAKQDGTRKRRIEVARSKLLKGDRRPCCYAVVPMSLYKALGANPKAKAVWKDLGPMERRDFVGWVKAAKNKAEYAIRVEEACMKLAKGELHP